MDDEVARLREAVALLVSIVRDMASDHHKHEYGTIYDSAFTERYKWEADERIIDDRLQRLMELFPATEGRADGES